MALTVLEGVVKSYRRGRNTQNTRQAIVYPDGVENASGAGRLLGARVTYTTRSGKALHGSVTALHGKKGAVRVLFQKPLPGEAIGQRVRIAPRAPLPGAGAEKPAAKK